MRGSKSGFDTKRLIVELCFCHELAFIGYYHEVNNIRMVLFDLAHASFALIRRQMPSQNGGFFVT